MKTSIQKTGNTLTNKLTDLSLSFTEVVTRTITIKINEYNNKIDFNY